MGNYRAGQEMVRCTSKLEHLRCSEFAHGEEEPVHPPALIWVHIVGSLDQRGVRWRKCGRAELREKSCGKEVMFAFQKPEVFLKCAYNFFPLYKRCNVFIIEQLKNIRKYKGDYQNHCILVHHSE